MSSIQTMEMFVSFVLCEKKNSASRAWHDWSLVFLSCEEEEEKKDINLRWFQ